MQLYQKIAENSAIINPKNCGNLRNFFKKLQKIPQLFTQKIAEIYAIFSKSCGKFHNYSPKKLHNYMQLLSNLILGT